MFVKADHYDDVNSKVCVSGALTLPKPANSVMVSQSISLLCATRERLMRMEQKTSSVEEKMAEALLDYLAENDAELFNEIFKYDVYF